MPTFAHTTAVRDSADGLTLVLTARHILVMGAPSCAVHPAKGRLPAGVDVIIQDNLVISISGKLNGTSVEPRAMQRSAIAQHLLNYCRTVCARHDRFFRPR